MFTANEEKHREGETKKYWRKRPKTLKNEIRDKKRKQPKIASNEEIAALTLEGNTANTAIQAIQQI